MKNIKNIGIALVTSLALIGGQVAASANNPIVDRVVYQAKDDRVKGVPVIILTLGAGIFLMTMLNGNQKDKPVSP